MSFLKLSRYNHLGTHRVMLRDRIRCETFRRAISQIVLPGDVVLDMGAGTGILSIFAAKAGARKVYAIEAANIVQVAAKIIALNQMNEKIVLINQEMESVELPEQVDVIVSEWLGGLAVDENFLASLLLARDRWLRPNGAILPTRVTVWMAPVLHLPLENNIQFWRCRPYDIDLSTIADITLQEQFSSHQLTRNSFAAEPQSLWTIDTLTFPIHAAASPFHANISFQMSQPGKVNALCAWFEAEFGQNIRISTAPDAPKTHWGQTVFPLKEPFQAEAGDHVAVEYVCQPEGFGHCLVSWKVVTENGIQSTECVNDED